MCSHALIAEIQTRRHHKSTNAPSLHGNTALCGDFHEPTTTLEENCSNIIHISHVTVLRGMMTTICYFSPAILRRRSIDVCPRILPKNGILAWPIDFVQIFCIEFNLRNPVVDSWDCQCGLVFQRLSDELRVGVRRLLVRSNPWALNVKEICLHLFVFKYVFWVYNVLCSKDFTKSCVY